MQVTFFEKKKKTFLNLEIHKLMAALEAVNDHDHEWKAAKQPLSMKMNNYIIYLYTLKHIIYLMGFWGFGVFYVKN